MLYYFQFLRVTKFFYSDLKLREQTEKAKNMAKTFLVFFFVLGWRSMRLQPLSVFLVKNGQGGDRILFRYPYKVSTPKKATFFGNTTGNSGANQRFIVYHERLVIVQIKQIWDKGI